MGNKNSEKILTVESNSYLIFNEKYDSGAAQGSPCLPHISPPKKKKIVRLLFKEDKKLWTQEYLQKVKQMYECLCICEEPLSFLN